MSGSPISKRTKFPLLAGAGIDAAFNNGNNVDENWTLAEAEEPEIKPNIDENRHDNNRDSEKNVMSTLISCTPFIITEVKEANRNDGIHNYADKLCEQELLGIFENTCLHTNDLLNFRLVKKSWCEAATTVLLQRNACQLQFTVKDVREAVPLTLPIPVPLASSEPPLDNPKKVYCNFRQENALLKDLIQLISPSPKFPSTSLRLMNESAFGTVTGTGTGTCTQFKTHNTNEYVQDLTDFFLLHGHMISSLCLGNFISRKELGHILTSCAPYLTFLDLSFLTDLHPSIDLEEDKRIWDTFYSVRLPLKSIRLGSCFVNCNNSGDEILIEIIANSKHLLSIEDPNQHLPLIVSQNLVSLVKDLVYNPYKNNTENNLSTFRAFSKLNPKLSQLTVDLTKIIPREGSYSSVVKYLNFILESSKGTLTKFEIGVNPSDFLRNIKIPSMKNLKSLKLTQVFTQFTRRNKSDDEPGQKFKSFRFCTSSSNYECGSLKASFFPAIVKVELDVRSYHINNRLLGFFKFNSVAPVKPYVRHGDVISSVKALEICGSNTLPDIRRAELMSKLFPAITTLKIKCDNTIMLVNSLWVLCPLAEYVEIYGVSNSNVNFRKALKLGVLSRDGGPGRPSASFSGPSMLSSAGAVSNIDHFFTGFPVELCEKLRRKNEFPAEASNCEANANFLRKDPSICSLKYLKDFKMKFLSLSKPFASEVAGIYAFQKMPGTSITFSFDVAFMTHAQINDAEKYLEPLTPYLQLTRGK